MHDRIAILIGIFILILGISVYLAPIRYEMIVKFLPMSFVIVILALGALLLVVGFVSVAVERL